MPHNFPSSISSGSGPLSSLRLSKLLFELLALKTTPGVVAVICSRSSPVSAISFAEVLQTLSERAPNDCSRSIFPSPSVSPPASPRRP